MKNSGFILLHRDIQNKEIWDDPEILRCWIDILFLVDYDDTGKHGRGCHKITDSFLQRRWNVSRNKVRRILALFVQHEMIQLQRDIKKPKTGTILKVTNYAVRQDFLSNIGTIKGTKEGTIKGTQTKEIKNKRNNMLIGRVSEIEGVGQLPEGWLRDGFIACWEIYPRKVNKKKAIQTWYTIHKKNKFDKALADEIYRGIQKYNKATQGKDKSFISHFTSWINARRWEDEETDSLNHQKKKPDFERFSESDELPDLTFGGIE